MTASPPPWESWAPPLNPPAPGGLPIDQAQAIADAWWATDPHLCAALQWESYAATLPMTPTVSQVATGAQSVSYSPAQPGGEYGLGGGPRTVASLVHHLPCRCRCEVCRPCVGPLSASVTGCSPALRG